MLERFNDQIDVLTERVRGIPSIRWATVQTVSPLTIKYDGETVPVAGKADIGVQGLTLGDRVMCVRVNRRDTIIGVGASRTAYQQSGSVTPEILSWESSSGGLSVARIQFAVPTPRVGYTYEAFQLESLGVGIVQATHHNAATSRLEATYIQHGSNSLNLLKRIGWRQTQIGLIPGYYFGGTTREWTEGLHWDALQTAGDSSIASLAVHGGAIEPGSQEMARRFTQLTGASSYIFDAKRSQDNWALHLTSNLFDHPPAQALVRAATFTFSFHGAADRAHLPAKFTHVGGLDAELKQICIRRLNEAGFTAGDSLITEPGLAGVGVSNICNLGPRGGLQLELSNSQRRAFFPDGNMERAAREDDTKRTQEFHDYMAVLVNVLNEVRA